MYKAYIMVVTKPEDTKRVYKSLGQMEKISEANEVMGPYDIVVEVEVDDLAKIPPLLNELHQVPGIEHTVSLVAFPQE